MANGIDELRNLAIARVARSAERWATAELARERGADMRELAQRLQESAALRRQQAEAATLRNERHTSASRH